MHNVSAWSNLTCVCVLGRACRYVSISVLSPGTDGHRNRHKESIWAECLKNPSESKLHRFFQLANFKYLWTEHFLSGRKESSVCVSCWFTLGCIDPLGLCFISLELCHHPLKKSTSVYVLIKTVKYRVTEVWWWVCGIKKRCHHTNCAIGRCQQIWALTPARPLISWRHQIITSPQLHSSIHLEEPEAFSCKLTQPPLRLTEPIWANPVFVCLSVLHFLPIYMYPSLQPLCE